MEVLIIGAGIGGLTLGLMLHRAGIGCRIFEAAPELNAVGVGINILPHASRELCALGLEEALAKVAVTTREYCFYNRFGQLIYAEPAGRAAGYPDPQYSIHRADLHEVLLGAVTERLGPGAVATGHRVTRVDQDDGRAIAHVELWPPMDFVRAWLKDERRRILLHARSTFLAVMLTTIVTGVAFVIALVLLNWRA